MVTARHGHRLVGVAGTGTEVGKTWFAAQVAAAARKRGVPVKAWKPAQSFADGQQGGTDAEVLAAATGATPADVCPSHRWYAEPLAPVMAAQVLNRPPFSIADLAAETTAGLGRGPGLGLVETAGGLRSPLADDGDCLDLLRALRPDVVVVVAHAGLGTLHDCRSAAQELDAAELPSLFVLNRFDSGDGLHRRNRSWLRDRERLSVASPIEAVSILLDAF